MRALLFALVTLWASAASAATYEETFSPKAGRAYNEDINVWVYTPEFAKRFGMPAKWVGNDLKGAYAVAFRVETSSARLMFPHKGPGVSMPQRDCILDVYLPASAHVPWADVRRWGRRWLTPASPAYLAPQSKTDREWRRQPVGLPHWGGVVKFGVGERHLGGFPVREYDKKVYPGVAYLSFAFGCMTPPKSAAWIEFMDYEPRHAPGTLWELHTKGLLHRIEIPAGFMGRLYDDWLVRSRKPAAGEWKGLFQK